LEKYGKPDIFNTNQGSQFTSFAFTNVLRDNGIRISMDGKGRWLATCLSNAFGEASRMNACTCTPLRLAQKLERASADGLTFTTSRGHTAAWAG
jgi:hypothetical protein